MLAGHGECGMNDSDRHGGCTLVRDALRVEFYQVEEISLRGGRGVSEECDVLMITGPSKDPTRSELDALEAYLGAGGKLLVMIDPFSAQRLAAWLRGWGIDMADDIVVDPQNRLGGGEPLSAVATNVNRQQIITRRLEVPPLFSGVRSLRTKDDEERERVGVWLLRSGEQSWATSDSSVLRGTAPRFVAGRDINGPLTLAAEMSMPAPAREAGAGVKTRIVAFGDSDFVSNRFLDYLGNRDLLLNSVNWLAREERLIAPRTPSREPGKEYFYPTQQDLQRIFFTAALAQPGLFLLAGIVVFVWRRRKA